MTADRTLDGVTVLLVEDHDDNRELLAAALATYGAEVIAVPSARQAFECFPAARPTVVISDIWMSDWSGIDLVRAIRALPPEQGGLTPAISISGAASDTQTIEAGFHYHFIKPLDLERLVATIGDFAHGDSSRRARWTVRAVGDSIHFTLAGHVTACDMHDAVASLAAILARAPYTLIDDLRELKGFDPSVAAVAQVAIWRARKNIRQVVVVGGSRLAQLVSRAACGVLGIPCECTTDPPRKIH